MDVTNQHLFLLGSSLAIGLLIGMERGWHAKDVKEGQRIAGIRTYALIGLLGGLTGFISNEVGGIALGLISFGFTIFITTAHVLNSRHRDDVSITGLIAIFVTFLLGTLATMGFAAEAASVAIVTAIILRFKLEIHSWLNKIEKHELHATLELLLISVVLLTILPNEKYGPWGAVNPFEIWWLVVLVASISFLGYFAMKIAGPRKGIVFTSLFSGLVSSTALTLHFSKLANERKDIAHLLSLGILISCGMMFFRFLIALLIINFDLFLKVSWPALMMSGLIFLSVALGWRKSKRNINTKEAKLIKNPLAIKSALIFGFLLTIVSIAIRAVSHYAGDAGLYSFAALSGLLNVDSIALSLARMVTNLGQMNSFAMAIILAASTNTMLKALIAYIIGGKQLFLSVSLPLILSVCFTLSVVYVVM